MLTPNKPPLAMTIHELFQQLALVMEKAQPAKREEFGKSWLNGVLKFNAETEWMRQERVRKLNERARGAMGDAPTIGS